MTVWGNVKVGDYVTSRGRHGVGQPPIAGKLIRINDQQHGLVRLITGEHRTRTIRNLRKFGKDHS